MKFSKRSLIFSAVMAVAAAATPAARADWDLDRNGDDLVLRLDVDNNLTRTEVEALASGGELVVVIREFVGADQVDEDDFDRDLDDITSLTIRGGQRIDEVTIDPSLLVYFDVITFGNSGHDSIVGGTLADGGRGNDTIRDAVVIRGSTDRDFLYAGPLTTHVYGGDGSDQIRCGDAGGPVVVYGQAGGDLIVGSPYDDYLDGGTASTSANVIHGEGGRDILLGGPDTDYMLGGPGNDFLNPGYFNGEAEIVIGDGGRDVFNINGASISQHLSDEDTSDGDVVDYRSNVIPYFLRSISPWQPWDWQFNSGITATMQSVR